MQARIRDYEEILTLQEKAIEALKSTAEVLQQALYVLERARAEHGYQQQMPWNQPQQAYYIYPSSSGPGTAYGGGMNVNNQAGNQLVQYNTVKENFEYVPETIYKY